MTSYPLRISCPDCHKTTEYRGFAYSIGGELLLTTFCDTCQKERYLRVMDYTLRDWARKIACPDVLSPEDATFLKKEMGIVWDAPPNWPPARELVG